ncbi:MAG TPA: peroxiredoxin, partial [Actinomycetota bacterium]|nr:peroxiredoxin [Actinomycetota bacterium]
MLQKGDEAPDFEMTDQGGKTWSLGELRGQKFVLYFYPADDTPGCTKESCDFRDSYSEWTDAGYQIFGVSPQGIESKKKFADKYSLPFPLLADEGTSVTKAYGAFKDDGAEWDG